MNSVFKEYICELATLLSNNNPEIATELWSNSDFVENPSNVYKKTLGKTHNINNYIWEAQVKIFFPYLEKFRNRLIKKYGNILPQTHVDIFGQEKNSPSNFELGDIVYICLHNNMDLLEKEDYEKLKFFKGCRDLLAHTKILSYDELNLFIKCI